MIQDEESGAGGRGGRLSRSETVTVRLDPQLRYLAELAARQHRRTLSSYIEFAVRLAVGQETLGSPADAPSTAPPTLGQIGPELWDVDEPDRFAKLAFRFPHLLTYDEQVLWKAVLERDTLWAPDGEVHEKKNPKPRRREDFNFQEFRQAWPTIRKEAFDQMTEDFLNNVSKSRKQSKR